MRLEIIDRDYSPNEIRDPISVCITILNEAAGIVNFLNSMFRQKLWPDDIVIVDAGSTDGTVDRIMAYRDQRINVLRIPGILPAAARNLASRAARHELQIMIDAGTILEENVFANLVGPLIDGADISAGIFHPIVPSAWAQYFIPNWKNESYLREKFLPSCRSVAMRRALIQRIKFDESFPYKAGEDTLFMLRAKDVCDRWTLNRRAVVRWDAPTTKAQAVELARHYGRGNGIIACDLYQSNRKVIPGGNPVFAAAREGYVEGQRMRNEMVKGGSV